MARRLAASLTLLAALAGCIDAAAPSDVAVASYPAAFLVESIGGADLRVADLGTGTGLHDFEPSARTVDALRRSGALALWDPEVEAWAESAASSLGSRAPPTWILVQQPATSGGGERSGDGVGGRDGGDGDHQDAKDDGTPTGDVPRSDGDHDVDDGDHDGDADDHHDGHDPHSWLDPRVMAASARHLAGLLAEAHPRHAANFSGRAQALESRLLELDAAFATGLADCRHDRIVTNHDAYAYLARRYDFGVQSLHGIHPGAEASPDAVARAIQAIRESGLGTVFVEQGTDASVMAAIQQETGVRVAMLHTLETRPRTGDYLTAQEHNLQQLREAMGCR